MHRITAFALISLFTLAIAALILPAPEKPKSSGKLGTVQTIQLVANPFEFLPAPPSSIAPLAPPSQQYVAAQQMMMKGRLSEAQDQYLQILLSRSLIDQQAMQGLTKVEGLLASGDPEALQRQAEAYRQALVRGSAAGEPYTPRALDLLAQANLLAAQEIGAAQAPRPTAIGSIVPTVSGIPQNTLRPPATPTPAPGPPTPSALGQTVLRIGSVLNPASAGSGSPLGKDAPPISPDRLITIPIPLLSSLPDGSTGAGASRGNNRTSAGGGGSWGGSVKGSTGAGPGGGSSWGSMVKGGTGAGPGSGSSWGSTGSR